MGSNNVNWFKIQDKVKADFLTVIEDPELIRVVRALNVRVPGFSKRINNAPIPLLRQGLEAKLDQLNPLYEFMEKYSFYKYEELNGLDYDEGIRKIASDESLTNAEIIALLGALYPTKYLEMRKKFADELGTSANLLANIVEISLIDVLDTIVTRNDKVVKRTFEVIDWPEMDVAEDSLTNYFSTRYKLETGAATSLLLSDSQKQNLTKEEQDRLYQLAVIELFRFHSEYLIKVSNLEEIIEEKDEQNEKLKKEITRLEARYEQLELDKNKKIANLKKEAKTEVDGVNELVEKQQQAIQDLESELVEERTINHFLINETDPITLFTERRTEYTKYIHNSRIIGIEHLETHLQKIQNDKVHVFVDVFSMSTKNKRKINQLARKENCRIRLLNGTSIHIIRNVIYYLEGIGLVEA